MKNSVVTHAEYERALVRLDEIINLVNDDTPENNPFLIELVEVSDTIEAYEEEHFPIGLPS
jgi:HTH-type transcriptional regulator / antitoxin HigA